MSAIWRGVTGNVVSLALGVVLAVALAAPSSAQQMGRVEGTVVQADNGEPVGGVRVTVVGTNIATLTGTDGSFVLQRVPTGTHTLLFRWLGFQAHQESVTVAAGITQRADVRLQIQAIVLGEVIVSTASRSPERVVEAPAAIAVISPVTLRNESLTGQAPRALAQVAGVDVVQSGINDFNVNARGFNSSLNRRILVMQDGRDLAIAFLGSQEWNGMSLPLDDISRMEVVRGPGSALYGANAFSGVINITTPPARDVVGTKLTMGGGELGTFKSDLRHAGVTTDGRFGYKFNFGYYRSDSWTRSRTAFDGSDANAEYREATDSPFTTGVTSCAGIPDCLPIEARPLNGQGADATGAATGDPKGLQNVYFSSRFDYYQDNGSMFTVEGGGTRVENEVFVTGIGRVQVTKALRPWARAAWASDHYNVFAWYSGRNSLDPQFSLGADIPLEESSSIFHFEGQYNRTLAEGKATVVLGASYRNYNVDTQATLMMPADDDRSDNYYSAYGQFDYELTPQLRVILASRVDGGTLFATQFSPKAAIVFSPDENHSIRATVNRAFQTPNYSEFFLRVPAGAPQLGPAVLEQNLEAYYAGIKATLPPPLVDPLNLPDDLPWDFATQTAVLALGNANLEVEHVTGWELGYKGTLSDRAYLSVDLYLNELSNFVTDLLPGVNPAMYPWFNIETNTDIVANLQGIDAALALAGVPLDPTDPTNPRTQAAALLAGYEALLASPVGTPPTLSMVNGVPTLVVSYANAGEVQERGVEIGFGYGVTPEFRIDGSYTFFDFEVENQATGDALLPNTAKHKGTIALTYTGLQGFDAALNARLVDSYDWAAGVFSGSVPSSQFIDLIAGYRVNNKLRLFANTTNLLDQKRFQLYGGSVIGRRFLAGATATF